MLLELDSCEVSLVLARENYLLGIASYGPSTNMCLSLSPLLLKNTYQVELHLTFNRISLSGLTAERLCKCSLTLEWC